MSQQMEDAEAYGDLCKPEYIVEVRVKQPGLFPRPVVQEAVARALYAAESLPNELGPLQLDFGPAQQLADIIAAVTVTDIPAEGQPGMPPLRPQDVSFRVIVYHLFDEGPSDETDGDESLATYKEWELPSADFSGMWEALLYESEVKDQLVRYAVSALHFADLHVDPQLICWNRVVLLHGPPGTGKTSLCKALAQKLSIRFSERFAQSVLIEVNAHSLFSKWFSESGKLVGKLFEKIGELVDDPDVLVFVLIDEVESLSAARRATGSEPSDAIRVVNALLTQLDNLRSRPNVMVLTTSNITGAIDVAFVDRADIKAYIGPPGLLARYGILRSCVLELIEKGVVRGSPEAAPAVGWKVESVRSSQQQQFPDRVPGPQAMTADHEAMLGKAAAATKALWEAAAAAEGLSGRALRKAPFLAHSTLRTPWAAAGAGGVPLLRFLQARRCGESIGCQMRLTVPYCALWWRPSGRRRATER